MLQIPTLDSTTKLGCLHLGQSKFFWFRNEDTDHVKVSWIESGGKKQSMELLLSGKEGPEENADNVGLFQFHKNRQKAVVGMRTSEEEIKSTLESIDFSTVSSSIKALSEDLRGQAMLAFNPEHYKRWGCHYLPSLARAHELQICNNFKDTGVQQYGGAKFCEIRDEIDDLFCGLPAPVPTPRLSSFVSKGGVMPPARVISMAAYNSSANPCFHSHASVALRSGGFCQMRHLKPGNQIRLSNLYNEKEMSASYATIQGIVETVQPCGFAQLVKVGDLLVTPYHPIRCEDESKSRWVFPVDLAEPRLYPCSAVFSLLLDRGHCITVDGIDSVTLGHDAGKGSLLYHPFFGNSVAIRSALFSKFGRSSGLIRVKGTTRDVSTGLVNGFEAYDNRINNVDSASFATMMHQGLLARVYQQSSIPVELYTR
uniref:Hint domain-containing protein n=1 Tax=Proboscia inermis TaxID=420281 RepID=A0A7S0CHI9_9STRA|mmetsp:Transcript_48053/g.48438  ORF Transcript_48053/g.48438 Transcript_48053/m.48438 type:complete len:426 (+) Transcript_48053:64-1341(+)